MAKRKKKSKASDDDQPVIPGRDELLAVALAAGATIRDAAKQVGYSERHAYRIMREEGFEGKVCKARDAFIDRAYGQLISASADAAKYLAGMLTGANPAQAISAARTILDFSMRYREKLDLIVRVQNIEQHLKLKEFYDQIGQQN